MRDPHYGRPYVDSCLREVSRRLLGRRAGSHQLEEPFDAKNASQVAAWTKTCVYLDGRIHSTPDEKPGRTPDMSPAAAAAMRAVLKEVGLLRVSATVAAAEPKWAVLRQILELGGGGFETTADGVAGGHGHAAREEAARKLLSNHVNVLKDITNPSATENIDGAPLTQLHLKRVAPELTSYVDACLREVTRRLLGRRPGLHQLEERPDGVNAAQAAAWAQACAYLAGRIQSSEGGTEGAPPGRSADMSRAAAAAMKAVLHEVGGAGATTTGASERWATLQRMLDSGGGRETLADGAAAGFAHATRIEAASKILGNHERVLKDIANPSATDNIDGTPLTQLELYRVPAKQAPYADQCLREITRRLLGRRPGSHELLEKPDPSNAAQLSAWAITCTYLDGRIQASPAEKPGREPDMSPLAAAAMRAVLREVSGMRVELAIEAGTAAWAMLHRLLDLSGPFATAADGAAAAHGHAAREEAARKLIANHELVLKDVTNPTLRDVTDSVPLTQLHLQRVAPESAQHVDQCLREVARRLLGRRPGVHQLEERLDASNTAQVGAWARAATYLYGRIHSTPDEKPGRTPDMSPAAAAAMRAVLQEICFEGVTVSLARGAAVWAALDDILSTSANGTAKEGEGEVYARKAAARRLISNRELVLRDVTNANLARDVTDAVPLTQLHLQRVAPELVQHAESCLREITRRLVKAADLGTKSRRTGITDGYEVKLELSNPHQVAAWAVTCAYLDGRIHSTPEEKSGRTPDLNPAAAAAMRAVLKEVGALCSAKPAADEHKPSGFLGRLLTRRKSHDNGLTSVPNVLTRRKSHDKGLTSTPPKQSENPKPRKSYDALSNAKQTESGKQASVVRQPSLARRLSWTKFGVTEVGS